MVGDLESENGTPNIRNLATKITAISLKKHNIGPIVFMVYLHGLYSKEI